MNMIECLDLYQVTSVEAVRKMKKRKVPKTYPVSIFSNLNDIGMLLADIVSVAEGHCLIGEHARRLE